MLNPAVLAALSLLVPYLYSLYRRLHQKRFDQYATIPQLQNHLLFGHLKHMGEFMKQGAADAHPDIIFGKMRDALGQPPLMLVDMRPVNKAMVLVADHEIAEQISRASKKYPASVPKTDLSALRPLIGDTSILWVDHDQWKPLRRRFTAGFAPQHLYTLLPAIMEKTDQFIDILDGHAASGDEVAVMPLIMNLTFDVIGAVVMGVDLNSQSSDRPGELIQLFDQLLSTYLDDKADFPWWVIPHIKIRRHLYGKRIDALVNDIIRRKWSEWKQDNGKPEEKKRDRSILSLSFQEYQGRHGELTAAEITETRDQLKTFLLAGHDTTSTAISWVLYELSRTPRALRAVRDEVDSIFGTDANPKTVRAKLAARVPQGTPNPISLMSYTSAVIKETMRLHVPTGSARESAPGDNFTVRTRDGVDHRLDGAIIYHCNSITHRDRTVYGEDADEFRPERWLDDRAKDIPASAWRSFERGPRACIGQEFALIEIKAIIAQIIRRYDFTKVGLGEVVVDAKSGAAVMGDDGQYKTKSELYVTRQITSKPVDAMRMKIKFTSA
ncbi:cytochrome P450 [Cladorrhinum samala]|uniref:Cytochrome P450 n=1 Tax=Cladorrhinum samala TaxID=585594 RepID=A0AAV9HLX4_9PEZI|nr:cytochrome P450 [Cladorrhinum samala]